MKTTATDKQILQDLAREYAELTARAENQVMPYSEELPRPAVNTYGAKMSQLWVFFAAQELTLVSPEMHEEFYIVLKDVETVEGDVSRLWRWADIVNQELDRAGY